MGLLDIATEEYFKRDNTLNYNSPQSNPYGNTAVNGTNIKYILSFLILVIGISWVGGLKPTFWFLMLVLAGMIFNASGKYKVTFTKPEIIQEGN
jgi:hypothetical protein